MSMIIEKFYLHVRFHCPIQGSNAILTGMKGLHHPLDGVTIPEYKLLHFIQQTKFFGKEKKALAFN